MVAGPLPRRPAWAARADGLVVALVAAVDLGGAVSARAGAEVQAAPLGPVVVLLVAAHAGLLWRWRRRRPLAVLGGVAVVAIVAAAAAPPGLLSTTSGVVLVVAVYAAAAWSGHRRWAALLPALGAGLLVLGAIDDDAAVGQALAVAAAVVGLPWTAGVAARSRRLYVEEVEQRLARAEADRDESARRAVADERAHIARELHDVVAHHVSLIGVQAGAARASIGRDPDRTRDALLAIEGASRTAVEELRTLLAVLRDGDEPAALSPPPGLGDLPRLVEGVRAAGLDVDLQLSERPVEPLIGLSAFRIVEEALTNVVRHSAAGRAEVVAEVDDRAVRVRVHDPGPARAAPDGTGAGRGLVGAAERAALFGGVLRAGPEGPGWTMEAVLPAGRRP
ncbi:MAG TPA: histidine kinase [Acidimicrobiales bacterium]|nr:histidine kinase [Acidimicrobiales bacterium]